MKSGHRKTTSDQSSTANPPSYRRHLGTVPVRNDRIIALREAKGWSQRTLATHAACSHATIKSIEAGKEAFPSTLERIAKPLGVSYLELMAKPVSKPLFAFPKRYVKIRFDIDIEFSTLDETAELQEQLESIRQIIGALGNFKNLSIEEGSVAVSTEMIEADALQFVRLFCQGVFEDTSWVKMTQIKLYDEIGCNLWQKLADRFAEVEWLKPPPEGRKPQWDDIYDKTYMTKLCTELHAKCRPDLSRRKLARKVRFAAMLMFEILLRKSRHTTIQMDEEGVLTVRREEPIGKAGDYAGV